MRNQAARVNKAEEPYTPTFYQEATNKNQLSQSPIWLHNLSIRFAPSSHCCENCHKTSSLGMELVENLGNFLLVVILATDFFPASTSAVI